MIISIDKITIDNVDYGLDQMDSIPKKFKVGPDKQFGPSRKLLTYFEKCRFKSGKIIMVVPSLQKTCRGLVFCSKANKQLL